MPVIQLSFDNLRTLTQGRVTEKEIIETLPYIGLDIEELGRGSVSVEYSPNRPDYSSEAGIARSLLGLLGISTGAPTYKFSQSNFKVNVEDDAIRSFRPHFSGFCATTNVTDELIKNLITMQEDLTNGIGRRRAKVAIGIHNADLVKPPIRYYAVKDRNFSFVPLYGTKPETISSILAETVQGRQYSRLVSSGTYPMLVDSASNVLSMPPIINGELTRLKPGMKKLFVDVTSTDKNAGAGATAIMAAMLSDIGAKVETIQVDDGTGASLKPDMTENRMRFDLDLTNRILGLNLSIEDARFSLEKSRLSLDSETAIIPAFRMDVMHSIDLAEDVALGYGIQKFSAEKTETSLSGSVHPMTKKSRQLVDLMVGFGLIEIYTPSLANKQLSSFFSNQDIVLRVDDSKSESYDFLKSEILPSLLSVLGSSTHEEYPQGIFEQSPVFKKSETSEAGVVEEEHLAAAIADSSANFSAIKSILEPLTQLMFGQSHSIRFEPGSIGGGILAEGRTALVSVSKANSEKTVLGLVGEVSPFALESFGLKVPVSAFEINLRPFLTN